MNFVFFLKNRLLFLACFIVSVCLSTNITYYNFGAYISESKQYYNAKLPAYFFYVKMKILVDFHVSITVPLEKILYFLQYPIVFATNQ